MAQASKGKLNFRCPSCFTKDIDMDMFYDEEKQEYYCLRCGFHGSLEDVLKYNEMAKCNYKFMKKRIISFNEDNEPLSVKDHERGTK